jgi:hypothetical protein
VSDKARGKRASAFCTDQSDGRLTDVRQTVTRGPVTGAGQRAARPVSPWHCYSRCRAACVAIVARLRSCPGVARCVSTPLPTPYITFGTTLDPRAHTLHVPRCARPIRRIVVARGAHASSAICPFELARRRGSGRPLCWHPCCARHDNVRVSLSLRGTHRVHPLHSICMFCVDTSGL